MKRILFLLMGFAMVASVKAQEIPERKMDKPGMHHDKHRRGMRDRYDRMKIMMRNLNLSEQQKDQLKKKREDLRSRLEALKKEENISVKEYRSRMESLRKEQKNSFESVLTDEQKALIEKKKKEAKGRFDHMAEKRIDAMKTRLGLTDEQAVQLKKNREELQSRLKAIREDKTLSAQKKKEALKSEMKAHNEKNKSILTEDQKKKMKEMQDKKGDYKGRKPGYRKEV